MPLAQATTLCVFSLTGNNGDLWEQMQDYRLAAASQGETLTLRAITDERIAAEDFKAGLCDGLMMTGIRARQFVPSTGSIDAIGGLSSYASLHLLIRLLAEPQLAPLMRHGAYEVAGIVPIGAAYLFINDRSINSVEKVAGHKMAVFSNDQAQMLMANRMGLSPVPSDVSNFAQKFNNGMVDIVAAPAVAYMPLELYRGVGAKGVVLKMPVAELTMQLVLRHDKFSDAFMAWSRRYFVDQYGRAMKIILAAENRILFFFPPPDKDRERYAQMMQDSRTYLIEAGIYDKPMMKLMKKVRCALAPTQAECANGSPW
jgi:hypothetical protein